MWRIEWMMPVRIIIYPLILHSQTPSKTLSITLHPSILVQSYFILSSIANDWEIVWKVTYTYFNNQKNWDNNPVLLNFNKRLLNQLLIKKCILDLIPLLSRLFFSGVDWEFYLEGVWLWRISEGCLQEMMWIVIQSKYPQSMSKIVPAWHTSNSASKI